MKTPAEQSKKIPGVDFVVNKKSLEKLNVNALLAKTKKVDCFGINSRFNELSKDLKPNQIAPLKLLSGLANYHVEPDDPIDPFKPMCIMDGKRTLIPNDLRSEQFDVIAEFAPDVAHRGLRARLADVVWFMQRRRRDMAALAIESYCDCIEQVRAGKSEFSHVDSPCGVYAREYIIRAASISRATKWELAPSSRLKILVRELVLSAYENNQADDFARMAQVAIDYGMIPCGDILKWIKELVTKKEFFDNPDARIRLWKIAARCYRIDHNDDGYNSCMIEISECHARKADLVESPGSSMLISSFLENAIQSLNDIPNTKQRRKELIARLRISQSGIKDEMQSFHVETDITEIVKQSVSAVYKHSWLDSFLSLVVCDVIPTPEEIRSDAQKLMKDHPLQGIISKTVHDFQGRVVYKAPGFSFGKDSEGDEENLRFMMSKYRDFAREAIVQGRINPIRRTIADEHSISIDIILEMIRDSEFVPPEYEYIYAKGIMRFLAGEDMEAAYLLVPQLENSLRYILSLRGLDTTKTSKDGIQTEASLPVLLDSKNEWRAELEKIMPSRYIHEIDLLFNFPGGPSLRNQMAHGKVPTGYFWTHNPIYAVWFIIHLTAIPLVQRWGDVEAAYARVIGATKPSDSDSGDSE